MIKPNKNLSFKKIKKIYHEEVKQEQPVIEVKIEQLEVLPDLAPIIEEKQPDPVQVVEGTEDLVNEFLSAIGAQDLVEVVSKPAEPKVKADASAFVDPAKLDDFLKNIQEEVPLTPAPIVEQTPPTLVTPVTKQVVDLTNPATSKKAKSTLDPNIKAINDRLGLFEKRLGDLAMRPMAQDPGGGETKLRFLDDVDRTSIVDGWFLKYNGTTGKFEFASPTAASFNETDIRAVYAEVKNGDSVTIHKGDPVYLYKATGNRASVILAGNTGDPTSAKTLGLAYNTFAPGATGLVITKGTLTGVDTQAYGEGDTLYLGATAGTLTNVKPSSPNHLVYIGVVERANQGQGQIYVSPQNGYELEELHNVNINHITALADGDYLAYNAAAQQWVNTRFPAMFSGSYADLTNKPALFSGSYNDLTDKPTLFSGAYADLTGKPTLFSGSYNDLTDKPTIPSLTGYATETYVNTAISDLIGAAPAALNTLKEIADQLATDESAVSSLTTAVAGKVSLTGSYADPTWITSLAYSKITGAPTAVSAFTNDASYVTSTSLNSTLSSFVNNASLVTTLGDYATKAYVTGQGYLTTIADNYITNAMLSGSIANSKLTNSSVTINGTSVSLGASATVTAAASTLTGTTLNSTVVSSSLTSVGQLTSLSVSGTTFLGDTLAVNAAGGITTSQTTFPLLNTTATTINFGGAATALAIGATTGTTTVRNGLTVTGVGRFNNTGTGSSYNHSSNSVNIAGVLGVASNIYANGNVDIIAGGAYYIGGASVLSNNTLGSNVVNSSLTSVGTLGSLTVTNNATVNGQVVTPNRVGFRVYGSGATNNLGITVNTHGALTSNNFTVDYNQGSALNTTSGVFTAPVAGLYSVNMVVRNSGYTSGIMQAAVVKNATSGNGAGGSITCMIEFAPSSTMNHAGAGTTIKLAVNDTLALKVLAGQINFDSNDSWSVAYLG